MVELTLLELGWRVLNLGPETPMAALAAAVRQHRPRLVWISITTQRPAPAFLEGYAASRRHACRARGRHRGRQDSPWSSSTDSAAAFGTRLAHLKEFARALAP